MDFGGGFAEDIVNNDWIQSLKERGISQLCPVLPVYMYHSFVSQ